MFVNHHENLNVNVFRDRFYGIYELDWWGAVVERIYFRLVGHFYNSHQVNNKIMFELPGLDCRDGLDAGLADDLLPALVPATADAPAALRRRALVVELPSDKFNSFNFHTNVYFNRFHDNKKVLRLKNEHV